MKAREINALRHAPDANQLKYRQIQLFMGSPEFVFRTDELLSVNPVYNGNSDMLNAGLGRVAWRWSGMCVFPQPLRKECCKLSPAGESGHDAFLPRHTAVHQMVLTLGSARFLGTFPDADLEIPESVTAFLINQLGSKEVPSFKGYF